MNYPEAKPWEILLITSQPIEIKKTPIILIEVFDVVPPGIEPGTHGFSVRCSTN